MQLLTLQRDAWDEPGVLNDGYVIGLKGAGFDDLLSVIAGGADALDRVYAVAVPPAGQRAPRLRPRRACARRSPNRPRSSASA